MNANAKVWWKRKRMWIPVCMVLLLIGFRLVLPTLIKNHVNKVLANIPGYYGQIKDIDVALWRGAYKIHGLYLNKTKAQTQVPFLDFPLTDISIQWRALLQGRIVAEIDMDQATIIYIAEDQKGPEQAKEEDWTQALTSIVPLDINRLTIAGGKLAYVEVNTDPNIDLQITDLSLTLSNLQNTYAKEYTLPSPLSIRGTSFGQGKFSLDGSLNILKEVPDMDLTISLENANLTAVNPFTEHYAGVDFEEGVFHFFGEVAIADGYFKGTFKPMLKNPALIGPEDGFLETVWEGFVGLFGWLLKNKKTDTFALKIPVEGNLSDINAKGWAAFVSIIENGWIEAFKTAPDYQIDYQDALDEHFEKQAESSQ
jgi:hypothetical protein